MQYNKLNVKLSNSQLNELKSTIKNKTEVVLGLLSSMIDDGGNKLIDWFQILVKLLLTNHQVILI